MRALALLPAAALVLLISTSPVLASVITEEASPKEPEVTVQPRIENDNADKIYENPTVAPVFPGGDVELYRYISRNMRYPEEAARQNIQGRVVLQFVIEKDGSVGDVKIIRGTHPLLDEEAIRVIKTLPKFIPGKENGEPVRVWFSMPLTFKLQGEPSRKNSEAVTLDPAKTEAPTYPGGEPKLYEFLARNIRYPEEAVVNNVQGTVTVGFTIEKDGSLTEFRVLDNPTKSEALANESLRVAKLLPKFIPAKYEGKPVRFAYTLPISYKMR